MKSNIIYLITNLLTHKIYIGKTDQGLTRRWKRHISQALKGNHSHLYNAIRKYGAENFSVKVLSIAVKYADLNVLEKDCIKQFKSNDPRYGYNMTDGGDGGPIRLGLNSSAETCRKISQSLIGNRCGVGNKGRLLTEEHRLKLSVSHKGQRNRLGSHCSDEHKRKLSEANKGNKNCLGLHPSEETRRKLSKIRKGKHRSEETRRKISQGMIAYRRSMRVKICGAM